MAIPTVHIVGPNGEKGVVNESSLEAWERNGWSLAKEKPAKKAPVKRVAPTSTAKKAAKAPVKRGSARSDSAETLDSAG
jgi:hypothetical protein